MNNASQCIFDICHVLKNVRDTMEFVIPRDHEVNVYNQRKQVLNSILDEKSFLGKFLKDNDEKLKEFKAKYADFVKEIYGDDSTVLMASNEKTIRVDHSQNLKILEGVVYLGETLRDILYSHIAYANQQNTSEAIVTDLVKVDEQFDRVLKVFLTLQEYNKSFGEFQKVMSENKGKPSPQSNFIVQNELAKMAGMIRFERVHIHATDNYTLDLIDEVIELIEMTEGRRDRRDDKPFSEFFKTCFDKLSVYINNISPKYQQLYEAGFKEMVAAINARKADQPKQEA